MYSSKPKRRIGKKKHINSIRTTKTYLDTHEDEKGRVVIDGFNNKPQRDGHKESTHFMSDDGKKEAWPRITEKKDSKGNITGYKEQSYKEALKAGEVYKFLSKKKMIDFAVNGSWKPSKNTDAILNENKKRK